MSLNCITFATLHIMNLDVSICCWPLCHVSCSYALDIVLNYLWGGTANYLGRLYEMDEGLGSFFFYMCHLPTFKLFYNWGYFTFGGMNLCELLTGILIWGIIKVGMRNRSEIVEETFGRCSFAKLFCPIYMRCVWWFWGLYCQKRMESLSCPYSLLISVVAESL